MEELKQIKEILVDEVSTQMHNLHGVNAKELGEVIDMIKDIAETMYYCSVVKAMENGKDYYDEGQTSLFTRGYSSNSNTTSSSGNGNGGSRMYHDNSGLFGRSPMSRRMYMEGKMNGHNGNESVQELENYMQELTQDLSEMIQTASPDEKQLLQRKVNALAAKLQNV